MRRTSQKLLPRLTSPSPAGQYELYPGFPIGPNRIYNGFTSLAERLSHHKLILIDGYIGVFWDLFRQQLDAALHPHQLNIQWVDVRDAMLPSAEIEDMITPYLGGDDPIFGTRFTGQLSDFFDTKRLADLKPDPAADLCIAYGCGAALLDWDACLIYVDLPKNEIQFRARAGSITNLGAQAPEPHKAMYKRFYFVDWIALNSHKAAIMPSIELIVDEQRPDDIVWMQGDTMRDALTRMSQNYFRVRPWFEPGAWGGQWIKQHIPQLPQDVPNYAWSFELIAPENGLLFESDQQLLEVSFDFLMYHAHRAVLGTSADRFGYHFPIRFDFLDTFNGGNLSVQCHPTNDYIKAHFGEAFTQDETYYILDCEADAQVYLGFQADIDAAAFRRTLEGSVREAHPVDIERFVQTHPAHKHDLFLIPSGTIHCSGVNNLVLEISATPYIFTFKMYDWLRLDLDGKPRPINIARAFDNLNFERRGWRVKDELISTPRTIASGDGWQLLHLPTHAEHFYDVHRVDIAAGKAVDVQTDGSCQVMSLVEGSVVLLETKHGMRKQFNYAETFVIPASAEAYRLTNPTHQSIKVIRAFLKAE